MHYACATGNPVIIRRSGKRIQNYTPYVDSLQSIQMLTKHSKEKGIIDITPQTMVKIHIDVLYNILCEAYVHFLNEFNKLRLILPLIQARRTDILESLFNSYSHREYNGLFVTGTNRKICSLRRTLLSLRLSSELIAAALYTNDIPTISAFKNDTLYVETWIQDTVIKKDAANAIHYIQQHSYWKLSDEQLELASKCKSLDVLLAIENKKIITVRDKRKRGLWKRIVGCT